MYVGWKYNSRALPFALLFAPVGGTCVGYAMGLFDPQPKKKLLA